MLLQDVLAITRKVGLGYEHTREEPAVCLWNDHRHALQEHMRLSEESPHP